MGYHEPTPLALHDSPSRTGERLQLPSDQAMSWRPLLFPQVPPGPLDSLLKQCCFGLPKLPRTAALIKVEADLQMAKKSVHLPRSVVCQKIRRGVSLADCCDDRRSQKCLACGIPCALAAEWVEPDRRCPACEPAVATNRVSDTRIRGKLRHRTFHDTNQSRNDAARPRSAPGMSPTEINVAASYSPRGSKKSQPESTDSIQHEL